MFRLLQELVYAFNTPPRHQIFIANALSNKPCQLQLFFVHYWEIPMAPFAWIGNVCFQVIIVDCNAFSDPRAGADDSFWPISYLLTPVYDFYVSFAHNI